MTPQPSNNNSHPSFNVHAFFYECMIRLTVPAWSLVIPAAYFRTPPEYRQPPTSLIATALVHWGSQILLTLFYAYLTYVLIRGTYGILHTAVFCITYMLPPAFTLVPYTSAYLTRKAPHRSAFKAVFALAAAYAYLPAFVTVLIVHLSTWLSSTQPSFYTLLPLLPMIFIITCPLRFSSHQPFGLPLITVFAVSEANYAAEHSLPNLFSRLL